MSQEISIFDSEHRKYAIAFLDVLCSSMNYRGIPLLMKLTEKIQDERIATPFQRYHCRMALNSCVEIIELSKQVNDINNLLKRHENNDFTKKCCNLLSVKRKLDAINVRFLYYCNGLTVLSVVYQRAPGKFAEMFFTSFGELNSLIKEAYMNLESIQKCYKNVMTKQTVIDV